MNSLFRLDVKQLFKNLTLTSMTARCFNKHGSLDFTALNNLFILMLSSLSRTLIFMIGPCLTTSPNTTQQSLLFQKSFSLLLSSFSRTLVSIRAPQALPSSTHGVDKSLHLDVKQSYEIPHFYAWTVLP